VTWTDPLHKERAGMQTLGAALFFRWY